MTALTQIREIYTEYLEAAALAEQKQKPTDGMFGIGKKAADDPCHTAFIDSLKAALEAYAQQSPASEETASILRYIYRMPLEHRSPVSIYWMLIAAHSLTEELIPFLSETDASALFSEYSGDFRRWERLPNQKKICRLLQKSAKKQH